VDARVYIASWARAVALHDSWLGFEEVPGFAVLFPAGALAGDVGIEAQAFAAYESFDGQDVPDVERQDVGDEDVDIFGGVDDFAFAVDAVDGLNVIAAGAEDFGAFELHAPKAGAGIEDAVVALAVSPQGLARWKPRVSALSRKAASESSPVRLVLRWMGLRLAALAVGDGFIMGYGYLSGAAK
jgi:hypothetical protein